METAASNVAWVKIASGQRGTGNGTVTLHVDAANGTPRSGTVTVAGQTVQIDQGTGCSYSIATDTVTVDAPGGDRQVPVSAPAGCTWIGESHATWIAIGTGSPGSGPGAVSFRVSPTDGPSRTGTLSVAGRTVVVTQLSGCSVSIAPSSLNVAAQGGASSIQISAPAGCRRRRVR